MHTSRAIIVAIWLAGCGEGDDDVAVGEDCSFDACGGDPTGAWTVDSDSVCDEPLANEECPEMTRDTDVDAAGSLNLADDGTFTLHVAYSGEVVIHAPLSCIDGATCADGSTPELDVTCEDEGPDQCRCVFAIDSDDSEEGTWQTDENVLVLLDPDDLEVALSGEYCARGDALVIRDRSSGPPYTWILRR